jgi:V/A-type H+-transporting ATPase subunit G/H
LLIIALQSVIMFILYVVLVSGGETMAKETIQSVRQAELNAVNREKEAIQKKEEIKIKAQQEAGRIIESRMKLAKEEAERNLSAANRQGEQLMELTKQRVEKEIAAMKALAKQKEEAAINLVLSSIV